MTRTCAIRSVHYIGGSEIRCRSGRPDINYTCNICLTSEVPGLPGYSQKDRIQTRQINVKLVESASLDEDGRYQIPFR